MGILTIIEVLGKGYSREISHKSAMVLVFFIGLLTTLYNYQFVSLIQIDMLPMIYRELDVQFLTNDFFTNSSQLFNEDFIFAKLVGRAGKFLDIPTVIFILTLLANLGIAVAAYFTTKSLSKGNRMSGLIATILFLSLKTFQWGNREEIFRYDLTPEHLIMPFLILCIWQGIRQRILGVGVFAALATIIHPLSGPGIGGIMLFQILIGKLYRKDLTKVECYQFINAGVLISIPALMYVSSYAHSFNYQMSDALFIEIMKVRFPHHYFPSYFLKPEKLFQGVLFLSLATFSWYKLRTQFKVVIQSLIVTSCIVIMLCGIGWFFAEVVPNRFIITLQLWRFLTLLKIVSLIGIAMFLGSELMGFREKLLPVRNVLPFIGAGVICFYFSLTPKLLISFLILVIVLILSRKLFWLSLSLVLLFVIHNNFFTAKTNNTDLFKYFRAQVYLSDLNDAEADLASFIRANTSDESPLLCGPRNGRLRILANRALVVDAYGIPMNDKGMEEWWRRINEVYNRKKEIKLNHILQTEENYNKLEDQDFLRLQQKYDFDFVVVTKQHKSELQILYQNDYLKLLQMPKTDS